MRTRSVRPSALIGLLGLAAVDGYAVIHSFGSGPSPFRSRALPLMSTEGPIAKRMLMSYSKLAIFVGLASTFPSVLQADAYQVPQKVVFSVEMPASAGVHATSAVEFDGVRETDIGRLLARI
ncbi:MAG TPA: hypothetical protein VGJ44_07415, partial [Kribbellaceae bacterium]